MRALYEHISTGERSFNAYLRECPAFEFNWHYHPEYELTLILESQGQRLVGNSVEDYEPGDLVLIGPDVPHTWRSDAGLTGGPEVHRAVVVQFRADFLGRDFFAAPELRGVARLLERSSHGLAFGSSVDGRKVAAALANLPDQNTAQQLLLLLGALQQLAEVSQPRPLCSGGFAPDLRRIDESRVDQVCAYVAEHYHKPINQAEMAERVGMNPAAFCRFFRRATGRTFVTYVNEARVSAACRLLVDTDDTLTRIGYRVGYGGQPHFCRQFRRLKGLTPGQFRKRFTRTA